MNLGYNLIINGYSAFLGAMLLIESFRYVDRNTTNHKLYTALIFTALVLLISDTLGRLDGRPDTVFPILNKTGNLILYIVNQLVPAFWLLYVGAQIYTDKKDLNKLGYIIIAVFVVNIALVIVTQFTGFYYYIDENNIYHRGRYNYVAYLLAAVPLIAAAAIAIYNRKNLEKKQFMALMLFPALPIACYIIQSFVYGLSLTTFGITIGLLIVYSDIQNRAIFTDYLTGVYNRMRLEIFLKEKVAYATPSKSFSAIMLDINNFKAINDKYGHDAGDEILKRAAKALRNCISRDDFLARFGGDEFVIVLDAATDNQLKNRVDSIVDCLTYYNSTAEERYQIEFSMGYKVYDAKAKLSVSDFERELDLLMYAHKQEMKKKAAETADNTPFN